MTNKKEISYNKANKIKNKFIDSFIDENFDKITIEDVHMTSLKYNLGKDKKRFKEVFDETFGMSMIMQILINGEVKFPIVGRPICWHCGKHIEISFDGKTIYNKDGNIDCFHDEVFSFDIKIPSGKLLLIDWPAYGINIFGDDSEDINCLYGRYKESKKYSDKNVMYFYVGNTCPKVSQKDNEIIIESPGYDEETDEEILYDESFTEKGYICTDLWWTTGIDLEYYFELLEKTFKKDMSKDFDVSNTLKEAVILDVTPGNYKCTSFYESTDESIYDKSQLFIKIEKIN